jgi:hypothetical protein
MTLLFTGLVLTPAEIIMIDSLLARVDEVLAERMALLGGGSENAMPHPMPINGAHSAQ